MLEMMWLLARFLHIWSLILFTFREPMLFGNLNENVIEMLFIFLYLCFLNCTFDILMCPVKQTPQQSMDVTPD